MEDWFGSLDVLNTALAEREQIRSKTRLPASKHVIGRSCGWCMSHQDEAFLAMRWTRGRMAGSNRSMDFAWGRKTYGTGCVGVSRQFIALIAKGKGEG